MKKSGNLEKSISKLVKMNTAFQNLNKEAEDRLGLSLVQYHFLITLRDNPGVSAHGLSDLVGMHPSSLTQSLKRLERRNLIFVEEDPRDSRKKILGITLNGARAIESFNSASGEFFR